MAIYSHRGVAADRCVSGLHAPQTPPAEGRVRLIVQGDDLGVGHGVNEATLQAYRDGILRSANVIVPGPWLLEAAESFCDNPGLDAGVHLAITSEWSSVKWRPLTGAPWLVDENGYFFPMVWPIADLPPHSSLKEASPRLPEIERELRAQIEMARRLIPQLTYSWEHMGFGSLSPDIRDLVARLTKGYGSSHPVRKSASSSCTTSGRARIEARHGRHDSRRCSRRSAPVPG